MVEWVPAVALVILLVVAGKVTARLEKGWQKDREQAKAEEWRQWQESRKP